MSWTDYRCIKCQSEFGVCVYPCRRKSGLLPPRRVSTPKNLDPKAFGINGEDSEYEREIIEGYEDLLK